MFAKLGVMGIARRLLCGASFRLHFSLGIHLDVDAGSAAIGRFGKEYLDALLSSRTTKKTGLKQPRCASFRCRGRGSDSAYRPQRPLCFASPWAVAPAAKGSPDRSL